MKKYLVIDFYDLTNIRDVIGDRYCCNMRYSDCQAPMKWKRLLKTYHLLTLDEQIGKCILSNIDTQLYVYCSCIPVKSIRSFIFHWIVKRTNAKGVLFDHKRDPERLSKKFCAHNFDHVAFYSSQIQFCHENWTVLNNAKELLSYLSQNFSNVGTDLTLHQSTAEIAAVTKMTSISWKRFNSVGRAVYICLKFCSLQWGWSRSTYLDTLKRLPTPISSLDSQSINRNDEISLQLSIVNFLGGLFPMWQSIEYFHRKFSCENLSDYLNSNSDVVISGEKSIFQSESHLLAYVTARIWYHRVTEECIVFLKSKSKQHHIETNESYFSRRSKLFDLLNEVIAFLPFNQLRKFQEEDNNAEDEIVSFASLFAGINDDYSMRPDQIAVDTSISFVNNNYTLIFHGKSLLWTHNDLKLLANDYQEVKFLHLYPFWWICRGIAAIIHSFLVDLKSSRFRNKSSRTAHLFMLDNSIVVDLCNLLLRDQRNMSMSSNRKLCCFSECLQSLRGFLWHSILSLLSINDVPKSSKLFQALYLKSIEDPDLTPEYKIILTESWPSTKYVGSNGTDAQPWISNINFNSPLKKCNRVDELQGLPLVQNKKEDGCCSAMISLGLNERVISSVLKDIAHRKSKRIEYIMNCAFPVWKLFDSSLSYLLQASAILDDFNGASEVLDSDQHHLYVEHVAILHYYELILKHESLSTSIAMSKAFLLSSKSVNWRPSETPSCIASLSSRKKSILESLMIMTSHNQVKIWCVSFKETRIWKFLVWALFSRELKAGMKYSFPRKHFHLPMEYPQESYLFDLIPPARYSSLFLRRRKSLMSRLKILAQSTSSQLYLEVYDALKNNEWILWGCNDDGQASSTNNPLHSDMVEIASLAAAIGGRKLSVLCETLLRYPETYGRGGPDLLFWCVNRDELQEWQMHYEKYGLSRELPNPMKNVDAKFCKNNDSLRTLFSENLFAVEVKSKNDSLSVWQMLWLELLTKSGINAEVLRVNH